MRAFFLYISLSFSLTLFLPSCSPLLSIEPSTEAGRAVVSSAEYESYEFSFGKGKRQFSGFLYLKPDVGGSVRAVAVSYFGMKVFDITISDGSYHVNECAGFMNKKMYLDPIVRNIREKIHGGFPGRRNNI
ncbi:MAG: hypothetical protein LKI59_09240 [Bacteroidales bacterium]|jgi:hypothetical protein|nr:hypothetical protein [Bacteroidales bacterium]